MYSVIVRLEVPLEHVLAFREAIDINARASVRDEPGCLSFDVLQVIEEPSSFLFYELYRDRSAFDEHRVTPHYAVWREFSAGHVVPGSQVNTYADLLSSYSEEVGR